MDKDLDYEEWHKKWLAGFPTFLEIVDILRKDYCPLLACFEENPFNGERLLYLVNDENGEVIFATPNIGAMLNFLGNQTR